MCAGLTGLLLALGTQRQQQLPPIVNLRDVNPYVASTIGDWHSRYRMPAALPRQAAPLCTVSTPGQASGFRVAGTSSFGMSGVNAHMLLAPTAGPVSAGTADSSLHWQRQRYWPLSAPHPLLLHYAPGPALGSACFNSSMSQASAAFLCDHIVGGRQLVPATCFFELIITAAAAAALDSGPIQVLPSLVGAVIQAPKILDQLPAPADSGALVCTLQLQSGVSEIVSAGGVTHVRASISANTISAVEHTHSMNPSSPSSADVFIRTVTASQLQSSVRVSWRNIAQLAGGDCGPISPGSGWLTYPAAADAALHLSAVKVPGLTDAHSRVPVGVGAVSAAQAQQFDGRRVALEQGQWSSSQLPAVFGDGSARCSVHAQLVGAGSNRLVVSDLHAKPVRGQALQQATSPVDTRVFEQRNFTYAIEWQASTAGTQCSSFSASSGSHSAQCTSGCGLEMIVPPAAAVADAGSGLSACLAEANRLDLYASGKCPQYAAVIAAGGIELMQRILAPGGSISGAAAVRAHTQAGCTSQCAQPAGGGRDISSAILSALMKVAAVEAPERQWMSYAVDRHQPHVLGQSGEHLAAARCDQHGAELTSGVLRQPRLQRHVMSVGCMLQLLLHRC